MSNYLFILYITIHLVTYLVNNQPCNSIDNITWNLINDQICNFSGARIVRCECNIHQVKTYNDCRNLITNTNICYITNQNHFWEYIARENDYINLLSGRNIISYGAYGIMAYKVLDIPFTCSNDLFGDPIGGVVKSCLKLTTFDANKFNWIKCSNKDEYCKFTDERIVKFGNTTSYIYKVFNAEVLCNNENFFIIEDIIECYYNICLENEPYYYPKEKKCYASCPDHLYYSKTDNKCYEIKCPDNYWYYGKECFPNGCKDYLLHDVDGKTCLERCRTGYFKFGNECVKECPFEFKILDNYECVIDCAAYDQLFSIDDRNCIKQCPEHQEQYFDYPICVDKEDL